ncbi:MAG TPA: histidinol-phosphate transaminase [Candidatus Sabulitectum sp.]|nr:histidinol-phosphate transaminase [Candidatus Sabulitectum sp.]
MKPAERTANLTPYGKKPVDASQVRMHMNENQTNTGRAVTLNEKELSNYPDEGPLQNLTADKWGIQQENLMLFNGASEAIMCAALALVNENDPVVTVKPEFSLILHYLTLAGAKLIQVPMRNRNFQMKEIEENAKKSRLVFISVPHNPTGATISKEKICSWCEAAPQTLFVIDEAYAGFAGSTLLTCIQGREADNLIVIRSFSKDMALAGVRLGAAAGPRWAIRAMGKVRTPFSINAAAVKAGMQAIRSEEETRQAVEETKRLAKATEAAGLTTKTGKTNFFTITSQEAHGFAGFCEERGVLIRVMPDGTARVSPADETGNQRYEKCLKEWSEGR